MMVGTNILTSPPARRARRPSADPCEMAENRKTGETAENGETLKRARAAPSGVPLTLPRPLAAGPASHRFAVRPRKREREFNARLRLPLPFTGEGWGEGRADAPMPETLKHETPASCSRAETVKHAPGETARIAPRLARETVKQSRKTQSGEGLTCFTLHGPAHSPETVLHQTDTVCETLKHPSVPVSGTAWGGTREIPKTVKTAETLRSAGKPVPPRAGPARGRRRSRPFLLSCPGDHGRAG